MDDALAARVAEATGDLSASPQTSREDLEQARVAVATAVAGGLQGDFLARAAVVFRPETDPTVEYAIRSVVAAVTQRQVRPQTVARRDFATLVSPDPMVGATAVSGRAVAASHGPFFDPLGRRIWLDVFDVVSLVGVQRAGAAEPFLYVQLPPLAGSAVSIELGPGSVWIDAAQLSPGVPHPSFIGLRIKSGTVNLGGAAAVDISPIVVPAAATVRLTIDLDPATPAAGTEAGADARNTAVAVPARATFAFAPGGGHIEHAGRGSLKTLGFEVSLAHAAAPGVFEPLVGRITLPMTPDAAQISVTDSRSDLVAIDGTAPLLQAGWSLPVTLAAAETLGTASGAGGIGLSLGPGLSLSWVGRKTGATAGPSHLFAEPGLLVLAGAAAQSPGPAEPVTLWQEGSNHGGGLSVRFPKPFPFRFVSAATGSDAFAFIVPFSAGLDRPVTVNDERVRFRTDAGLVSVVQIGSETFFSAYGSAAPQEQSSVQSFAIKNVLLKASDPLMLIAVGTLSDAGVAPGALGLQFILRYLLPTLPDPYATNVAFEPRRLREPTRLGLLTMLLRWQPDEAPSVDLLLPSAALGLTSRLPPRATRAPQTDVAALDVKPIVALTERFASLGAVSDAGISLLDVSTNVSLFGVSFLIRPEDMLARDVAVPGPSAGTATPPMAIADLFFEARGLGLHLLTLPAVQWEPVLTPDQSTPFPSPLTFADCGGPTVLAADSVELVPIAPRPAIDALLAAYNTATPPRRVAARFTLPFGIVAVAEIVRSTQPLFPSPFFGEVAPAFTPAGLAGGDQLSIRAAEPFVVRLGGSGESPSLPGIAVQLHNALFSGVPTPTTVLTPIDDTFNANFGPAALHPRVPVTRLDISGFGESLVSDWRNPADAAAIISKARFDVLVGRTSLEIVQAYSVLYPYAVRVVRTITIQRENGAAIVRHDSGWQAVSDGTYHYPKPNLVTHPGLVAEVTHVTNIRDTGQRYTTSDGSELMAVRFNCSVHIENVVVGADPGGVPAQDQLGYVQLTDPSGFGQLAPDQYAELVDAAGPLGGTVDCIVDIGGSGQRMRVSRVGVAATPGMGGAEFAMAAWGSPTFPGGGQWSVLRQTSPTAAPQPLEGVQGVPVVRAGPAGATPPPTSPYRFADPSDTLRPDAPSADYGIVHATGTQRTLFPRPKIEAGAHAITSTRIPLIADPFILATAVGLFPKPDGCIPFPDAAYALAIGPGGNFTLQRGSPSFTTPPLKRVIRESQASRAVAYCADENGVPSVVTLVIDTAAALPWSLMISNMSMAAESGSLGEVDRIVGTVSGSAAAPTNLSDSRFVFGPSLQPVAALVSFLEQFSPMPPLNVSMTNPWQLQVGLKFDFEKLLEQAPALKPFLEKFIVDLDVLMSWMETATSQNSVTTFEVTVKFPTPFTPVVAIGLAKVKFQMGDDGNAWTFQLGVGVGVDFTIGPFKALAYFAESEFLIAGDSVFGLGASALIKGSVDLEVVEIDISVEAKMALLNVTCGPDTTIWGVAQVTFALEVTIAFVIDIEFDVQAEEDQNIDGGPCALPNVV